ncbi:hypothetical protein BDQ94DRAFT_3796 [Aspergillus welwitschiae]|uniref:Uncharacterized protein n=1 Tax=Aspergillus welwitschiae TaxID=1341132 RepID=A0A3F3QJT3_9EURO|nr:hypothetical protein BDQ94DRAFT_3796 [Aspergillus welwitschiae]RDH39260.1 hypothetical protein BDQ94DRAFT_3796 [Aspergillus welwitschiae]
MMKMDGVKQDEQVQGHLGAWGTCGLEHETGRDSLEWMITKMPEQTGRPVGHLYRGLRRLRYPIVILLCSFGLDDFLFLLLHLLGPSLIPCMAQG